MNVITLSGISDVFAGSIPVIRIYACDTLLWQRQDVVTASEEFLTADVENPAFATADGNPFWVLVRNI
mgnify:CR=1 FL=1